MEIYLWRAIVFVATVGVFALLMECVNQWNTYRIFREILPHELKLIHATKEFNIYKYEGGYVSTTKDGKMFCIDNRILDQRDFLLRKTYRKLREKLS